jgi:hypothetical protein
MRFRISSKECEKKKKEYSDEEQELVEDESNPLDELWDFLDMLFD